ncbi:hypothetical protein FOZ61_007517 [Perkinsus olseni]|uniref:Uncharacterized protein n=1 Tax=Perkinsus olseni TaxID=32597 RepID=A0A7J6MA55_PEROL|nr:hypothetical protein FOZ61_007517 [Perkinsus olseni]KAF4672608.1 hypothetical protein FOL46_008721 [Perkinsus olseni]
MAQQLIACNQIHKALYESDSSVGDEWLHTILVTLIHIGMAFPDEFTQRAARLNLPRQVVLVVPPSSALADPSPSKATRSRRLHKGKHGKAGKSRSNNGQSKPATSDAMSGIFGELLAARLLALCSFFGLLMHDKIRFGRPAVQELHTQVLHSGGLSLILAGLDAQVGRLAKLTNSSLTKLVGKSKVSGAAGTPIFSFGFCRGDLIVGELKMIVILIPEVDNRNFEQHLSPV